MALTRLSPGVYRNAQGKTVYSTTGKTPTTPQKQNTGGQQTKTNVTGKQIQQTTQSIAGNLLNNSGFDTPYTAPTPSNNFKADFGTVSQIADQAFGRVNQEITAREARERSDLQSELANRGININNPEDPTYKRFMQDLERKFATERENAQQASYQQGLQGTIGLGNLEQGQNTTSASLSLAQRQQRMQEIEQLINAGLLARKANYTEQELQIAREAAQRRNQGGGGGQQQNNNPFNNTMAPSTPR